MKNNSQDRGNGPTLAVKTDLSFQLYLIPKWNWTQLLDLDQALKLNEK